MKFRPQFRFRRITTLYPRYFFDNMHSPLPMYDPTTDKIHGFNLIYNPLHTLWLASNGIKANNKLSIVWAETP